MDLHRARCSGWLRAALAVGILGFFAECRARQAQAQSPIGRVKPAAAACGTRDVRSCHFLIHTDLSAREADELVERLETMLHLISNYWGRPMQGVIECYVACDLDKFPVAEMDPEGIRGIKTAGGVTLMRTATNGSCYLAKSVVYASARPEVVQHEAVHAYCHHTFGRVGPIWYSEGMAELGHYWAEGGSAVCVDPREIQFLRENPKSLTETLSPLQFSGDSWQNYVSRWALCHFLARNPNYSSQFLLLGRGLLEGKDISFEQTYGAMVPELSFEYRFFLQHVGPAYRADLCVWDWKKEFTCLRPGRTLTATVTAGRGWQPTGLTVGSGMQYEYLATGNWRIAGEPQAVDANGDGHGRGRLVAALVKNHRLGAEFELGAEGLLKSTAGGDLYLRARKAWNELAGDSGRVAVRLKLQGRSPSLRDAKMKNCAPGRGTGK